MGESPKIMFHSTIHPGFYSLVSNKKHCQLPQAAFRYPFNKKSAHNRPIGTGAIYAGDYHPETIAWKKKSDAGINVGGVFGSAYYEVTGSEKRYNIAWDGTASGKGLPLSNFPLPDLSYAGLDPVNSYDNTLLIKWGDQIYEIYHFKFNNGNPKAMVRHTYPVSGLGHGTKAGERIGSSASSMSMLAGAIRKFEVHEVDQEIRHILNLGINAINQPQQLSRNFLLPATSIDGFATNPNYNNGPIPYGRIIALPPDIDIDRLGLSEVGKSFARAVRDYGFVAMDNGGGIRCDQNWDPTIRRQLYEATKIIIPLARPILNSVWSPNDVATGGGTPITPNHACFE